MKKLSLKKLSCLFLVLICMVTCITLPAVDASAKVVKPSKVAITALGRYNKSTVGLRWKKASRAKGYQVYMKTNGGKFKKIKTTLALVMTLAFCLCALPTVITAEEPAYALNGTIKSLMTIIDTTPSTGTDSKGEIHIQLRTGGTGAIFTAYKLLNIELLQHQDY